MTQATFRSVDRCPACKAPDGRRHAVRRDGVALQRCPACASLYLDRVPVDVTDLYRDNYFGLSDDDARDNVRTRIGYESSYETSFLDAEFYWAYRIADHAAACVQGEARTLRCLDVGAATGRLLNVFAAAGYETHGVEFSSPARAISASRGHRMSGAPAGSVPEHHGRFSVVTALEVIEHVEDLDGFFAGIERVMADRAIFVGYFPSADDAAFSRGPDYHWLHSSFEHLVYPSEAGIRAVLAPLFGRNVHVATFLTRQGEDVIPNSIVVAVKGSPEPAAQQALAELFRQLAYLNDRAAFDLGTPRGPGALGPAWDAAPAAPRDEDRQRPFVGGTLCAKFGDFPTARYLRREGVPLDALDGRQLADLLVMAMHEGGADWMRANLPAIGPRIPIATIVAECRALVARWDAQRLSATHAPGDAQVAPGHREGEEASAAGASADRAR